MTDERKEDDMICTGAVPPQVIMGMEMYQAYWQMVANYWALYQQTVRMMYPTQYTKKSDAE